MDRPTRDRGPAAAPGDLVLDQPAELVALGRWRWLLTGWLAETLTGPDLVAEPDLAEDIVLAVDEAVSNAVEHAYRDRAPGPVRLWAHTGGAGLTVVVDDRGCWRTPPPEPGCRGRGLSLIQLLAGHVELIRAATGTTVTMTWTTPAPGRPPAHHTR